MIKLIASDVDGTLVKESTPVINQELIQVIQKLTDQGIYFAVASGRKYSSIEKMFSPVKRNLIYIAENGAHIHKDGKDFSVTPMNRRHVEEIIQDLREYYPDVHVTASTREGYLVESREESFWNLLRHGYNSEISVVDDILSQEAEIIKVSAYREGSIRELGEGILIPRWQDRVKTCMAGETWVDFMDATVDKGAALTILQKELNVQWEETMAFGDNDNDVGLMMAAGSSYAVENAVEAVKQKARYMCPSYQEMGVYQILKTLVE